MNRLPNIAKQPAKPSQRKEKAPPEVPALITDKERGAYYEKGRFLGKGGFAHCYELTNRTTREVVAGKVVPKTMLVKQYQRDKVNDYFISSMTQEVQIHRELSHKNIVKLFHFFEDSLNVYITLELCARRSLMELHKRRKAVTEPEARYFTHQVVEGVLYLHDLKIIHRDMKLGNLFLNDDLVVKIGDFGLATTVDGDERKKTLCGTPNYIAPEVLNKMGHSFEVDIWAVGCILYILLFGQPPFESKSLEETYSRIRHNNYTIPSVASQPAAALIRKMLDPEPTRRPTAKQVHRDIFFKSGFMPTRLPVSCLTMVPKFAGHETSMMEENVAPNGVDTRGQRPLNGRAGLAPLPHHTLSNNVERERAQQQAAEATFREPEDAYLSQLFHQVAVLLEQRIPGVSYCNLEEEEAALDGYQSPECLPIFWISKWVDYSDKYGIGYQLCDNSVGVLFNDNSRIMLDTAGGELTYIEKSNKEHYFSMHNGDIPQTLNKKVTLLKYFRSYMNDHLVKAGEGSEQRVGDELARLPTLRVWFRTKSAIVLHLSNGTVQINFFNDHVKMMMCPLMQAVTFIDQNKRMLTYKFSNLQRNGCPEKFLHRLKYAKTMIERLMSDASAVSHNPPRQGEAPRSMASARSASAGSRGPLHSGGQLPQSASGSNIQPRR
ncbi:Protein CBR-PLK-1 [Caenorhabditis briggsae]|uniref:Serine/threonine-protein kinase PLK n=1 Tax=Caenorhabditis briggsae TaxID=6238 RepID=A8X8A2_CAEBR|nr:Protein CBR-PLK-1 [Caenorhabditis briggsae]CAP28863.2 Protein CBR-PLK-1 [Caenorhabditis briggsae]